MAREDTLRKIRALLSKEGAQGTTPEEVAAAVALAGRLMEREGITRATLELQSQEPEEPLKVYNDPLFGSPGKSRSSWRLRLASVLTEGFGCTYYLSGGAAIIVGRPSDAENVRYLFSYCEREIDRLAKINCAGEGKTYANNFRIGCCDAIRDAIKREHLAEVQAQRDAAKGNALMVVNNAIARVEAKHMEATVFMHSQVRLGRGTAMNSRYDSGARAHGRHAGSGIYSGVRKGIGGGTRGLIKG